MKSKGFFHIEFLFSVIISINLFVLTTQLFYNISKEHEGLSTNIVQYEALGSKIEYELKYANKTSININSTSIEFQYNQTIYRYYHSGTMIIMKIGDREIGMVLNVASVLFIDAHPLIHIQITNLEGEEVIVKIIRTI